MVLGWDQVLVVLAGGAGLSGNSAVQHSTGALTSSSFLLFVLRLILRRLVNLIAVRAVI